MHLTATPEKFVRFSPKGYFYLHLPVIYMTRRLGETKWDRLTGGRFDGLMRIRRIIMYVQMSASIF
jgi:hypothetical protein